MRGPVRQDHAPLAILQRMVQVAGQDDVARQKARHPEGAFQFRRQAGQHQLGARLVGGILDLGEAVAGRGIQTRHQPEIEHQETAFRMRWESSCLTFC